VAIGIPRHDTETLVSFCHAGIPEVSRYSYTRVMQVCCVSFIIRRRHVLGSGNLLSCSRHSVATARLSKDRSDNVIPL
jgi:hypothetical protein